MDLHLRQALLVRIVLCVHWVVLSVVCLPQFAVCAVRRLHRGAAADRMKRLGGGTSVAELLDNLRAYYSGSEVEALFTVASKDQFPEVVFPPVTPPNEETLAVVLAMVSTFSL